MDSEHIKTQYLSRSACWGFLPMQHISVEGRKSQWLIWESTRKAPRWIMFFSAWYILSLAFLFARERADLCKDHLSLHGITVSLYAGISWDYREISSYLFLIYPVPDLPLSFPSVSFGVKCWISNILNPKEETKNLWLPSSFTGPNTYHISYS